MTCGRRFNFSETPEGESFEEAAFNTSFASILSVILIVLSLNKINVAKGIILLLGGNCKYFVNIIREARVRKDRIAKADDSKLSITARTL